MARIKLNFSLDFLCFTLTRASNAAYYRKKRLLRFLCLGAPDTERGQKNITRSVSMELERYHQKKAQRLLKRSQTCSLIKRDDTQKRGRKVPVTKTNSGPAKLILTCKSRGPCHSPTKDAIDAYCCKRSVSTSGLNVLEKTNARWSQCRHEHQ